MANMRFLFLFFMSISVLTAKSPFETPASSNYDLSVFNSDLGKKVENASKEGKVRCRIVCDKKIHKTQLIAKAINFYKRSSAYHFQGSSSK